MGAAAAVAVGAQVAGGAFGAYSAMQQGKASASYYAFMGNRARMEGTLAKATGERGAQDTERAAAFTREIMARNEDKALGGQRAAFAANGIAGSVTAQNITTDTMSKAELDQEAVRFNADSRAKAQRDSGSLAAFNYNMEADEDAIAGRNSIDAARLNAVGSILGSGGSLANAWYAKSK